MQRLARVLVAAGQPLEQALLVAVDRDARGRTPVPPGPPRRRRTLSGHDRVADLVHGTPAPVPSAEGGPTVLASSHGARTVRRPSRVTWLTRSPTGEPSGELESWSTPCRRAIAAASVRPAAPSLARMLETWTLTVLVLMNSWRPISPLLRPWATSPRISCSRAVRATEAPARAPRDPDRARPPRAARPGSGSALSRRAVARAG